MYLACRDLSSCIRYFTSDYTNSGLFAFLYIILKSSAFNSSTLLDNRHYFVYVHFSYLCRLSIILFLKKLTEISVEDFAIGIFFCNSATHKLMHGTRYFKMSNDVLFIWTMGFFKLNYEKIEHIHLKNINF